MAAISKLTIPVRIPETGAIANQTFDVKTNADAELSTTSSNAVQNKSITSEARLKTWMGTCTSAANERIKIATVDSGMTLTKGVRVGIKFTNSNTCSSSTSAPIQLNVNSTGAKNIYYNNVHSGSGNTGTNNNIYGSANRYIFFVYDGTYWVWDGCGIDNNTWTAMVGATSGNNGSVGYVNAVPPKDGYNTKYLRADGTWSVPPDNNTTYTPQKLGFGYGVSSTAAGTAEKAVTLADYVLVKNGIVSVKFTNAVQANATLNVNSKGAKNIFYKGVSLVANIIKAGDTATFIYDGTQYHLISIDRRAYVSNEKAYL